MNESTSSTSTKCRGLTAAALFLLFAAAALVLPACDTAHLYIDPATGQRSGRLLFARKCITCHDIFAPDGYTDSEWRQIMPGMARESGLSELDERLVLDFVLANN